MEKYINKKLQELNFTKITPIQKEVFEKFQKPFNLVCIAPTGTGKTHAYLLPILSKIKWEKNIIQAIIVVPTNELVFQVFEMIKQIEKKSSQIKIFYGGMNRTKIYSKLEKKQPSIIITTLNKLFEYAYTIKKINIYKSSFLVLDEADMLFDSKSLYLIKILLSKWKPKILLSSASLKIQMKPLITKYFGPSLFINIENYKKQNLNYYIFKSHKNSRSKDLINLMKIINPFIAFIFITKKKEQDLIYEILKKENFNILNFSSNLSVRERKKNMLEIKKNKYQYVLTSDLIARGLDIDVDWVIHFDLPRQNLEFFQHRNGRTGRKEKKGNVFLFYDEKDQKSLLKIKKNKNIELKEIKSIFKNFQEKKNKKIELKEIKKNFKNFQEKKNKNNKKNNYKINKNYKKKLKRSF
jgi:ATP-dependent RNA helicase CshB